MQDKIKIINVQKNPELKNIKLGAVGLIYTKHAAARCGQKGIAPQACISIDGNVVELEQDIETGKTTKLIVRCRYDYCNDLVLVLVAGRGNKLVVKTCWLNKQDDNHSTLNLDRIA